MHRLVLPLALLVSAVLTAGGARAQGLCQLHFDGRVAVVDRLPVPKEEGGKNGETRRRSTGHLVEIEIGILANQVERDVVLHVHLARGTTGADLASLIASRLERLGTKPLLVDDGRGGASLWIESTRYVSMRLGGGLEVDVACAEGPPESIRVIPPSAVVADARLTVSASTALVMRDRPPVRGRAAADIELAADDSSAGVAAKLWESTSKTWISDRPGGASWQPLKMASGAVITGLSLHLDSEDGGDWRVEIKL
ncbi:MAG: hypothetical protein AAGI22_24195 [Planctomycetota bacterium]